MDQNDLLLWRRQRKVTQADLAEHLGVSRKTLVNWELGKHRLPMDLPARLERLAFTLMPKAMAEAPTVLTLETARLRPDLRLYGQPDFPTYFGPEHPYCLGFPRAPDGGPYPFALLDTLAYKDAVARRRAQDAKEAAQRKRHETLSLARAAQARIGHDLEEAGDHELAAQLAELLKPPAAYPWGAKAWSNLVRPAREKWCHENGVPFAEDM